VKRIAAFSFFLLGIAASGFGQSLSDTLDIYDLSLEELSRIKVFSTTRTSLQEAIDAPANVFVVTSQQIAERGYSSLIDVFEDLPDFKIDRNVDPRWQNDVTLRGVRYLDKIILLLDGVRIGSPTNEVISFFENYPLYMAEQVEIVYGPSSALYGADAFSGVVNIVSKKAGTNQPIISGSIEAGMYNMYETSLLALKKINEDLSISVGGSYFYDEQPDLAKTYPEEYKGMDEELRTGVYSNTILAPLGVVLQPQTPINPNKAYPLSAYTYFAKANYKDFTVSTFGNYGRNPSTTANRPSNAVYNEEQYFGHAVNMLTGRYAPTLKNVRLTSQITYSTYRLDPESNFRNVFTAMEPAFLYSKSWKLKIEQLASIELNENMNLTTGITYDRFFARPRNNNLEAPVEDDNIGAAIVLGSRASFNPDGINAELVTSRFGNIGILSQFAWSSDELDATVGVRFDRDERFEPTVNPRIGLIYRPTEKVNIKALAGSAFLAPSPLNIYDRYGLFTPDSSTQSYRTAFFNLPNPDLDPQTIISTELGINYFFSKQLNFYGSFYYSQVKNLISPVNSISNPELVNRLYPGNLYTIDNFEIPIDVIQINENLGESFIHGGNIGVNYLWRPNDKINGDLNVNYSFIDGTIDIDEEGEIPERNLPGVSPGILRLAATIRTNRLTFFTSFTNIGEQRAFNVAAVQPQDNSKYKVLDGYNLLNLKIRYSITSNLILSVEGRNILNEEFRNTNIGANPNPVLGSAGSAGAEFANGAPQNPIRLIGGIEFRF
jgi:outer membrane receptor protein involved in Fe transport